MINTLEIDSVIKSFKGRAVLTDIYLKCHTGNIIGLLGRNGSGKSTLLKILFGVSSADGKFIKVNDMPCPRPFKSEGLISYLPQDGYLLKSITPKIAASLFLDRNVLHGFFDDPIISKLKDHKIKVLSGGELRYLEIKLLLWMENKFVLLDEPFNGLSPLMIDTVKNMILKASITKGIILTDHDHTHVTDIASKTYLLFDGGFKPVNNKEDLIRWEYVPA